MSRLTSHMHNSITQFSGDVSNPYLMFPLMLQRCLSSMHPYRRVPALPPRLLLCLSCAQKQCDTLAQWLQQVRLVFFMWQCTVG